MKKNILDFDQISSKLTRDQITELKESYRIYHKKYWAFKQAAKHFKKWKLLGDTLSVMFATDGIASAIATSGISLVAISTTSVIIQGWMKHKNLELKIKNCTYAYQSYQHLLIAIKDMMKVGNFQSKILHTMMNNIDNYVTDNSPIIDKFIQKYDGILFRKRIYNSVAERQQSHDRQKQSHNRRIPTKYNGISFAEKIYNSITKK